MITGQLTRRNTSATKQCSSRDPCSNAVYGNNVHWLRCRKKIRRHPWRNLITIEKYCTAETRLEISVVDNSVHIHVLAQAPKIALSTTWLAPVPLDRNVSTYVWESGQTGLKYAISYGWRKHVYFMLIFL